MRDPANPRSGALVAGLVLASALGPNGGTFPDFLDLERKPAMNTTKPRMWDTVETSTTHLSHDRPCPHCGHATHTYLPCSDSCDCVPTWLTTAAA
jgi:hypothetical protein